MTGVSLQNGSSFTGPRTLIDGQEVIQLRDYGRMLVRRRRVALTCLGAVVFLTAVFSFLAPPVYMSTATLQIERQGPEILNFNDVLGVDSAGYQDFYQTQYRILQSRAVLTLAAARVDPLNRSEYASRRPSPLARLAGRIRSVLARDTPNPDPAGDREEDALAYLQHNLVIQPVKKSHLVLVTFYDRDPVLARDIANAVVEAYQQFNLDAHYSATAQANEFLTKQVAQLQQDIADKEHTLQEYGVSKEILTLHQPSQDLTTQALADLSGAYVAAEGRLALAEARYMAAQNAAPDALPNVLNSPLISRLKQQYAEIESRHGQMRERFQPDWPALRQVGQELQQAHERLQLERQIVADQVRSVAAADFEKARAEVDSLRRRVDRQKTEVQRVNKDAIEYAGLLGEIQNKRGFLDELVNRRSQTEVSDRLRETHASNLRVVDPAKAPKVPVRPRKFLNILLSLVLGSIIGIGAAFVIDHLDSTIKGPSDVERLCGLPILGQVSYLRALKAVARDDTGDVPVSVDPVDMGSHLDSQSVFAEAFKNLRTSILLASPERPPRHIVVTSCEAGDGKSTVAVNLAIVLTQMGRRVLLVDADLRRPRVHKILRAPNHVGLSSILTGNARLDDALQVTAVPNLSVLTSGPIPPTPSELLGSPSLQALLDRVSEEGVFDHIILDTTPSLQVSDSVILAARTDATILVVRCGKTARESLIQAVVRLRQAHVHVVGTVLNAVPRQGRYSYYHYGHSRDGDEEAPAEPVVPQGTEQPAVRKTG